MGWNGDGTFSREHNWQEDADNDIDIVPDRHDAEDDNLATGIQATLAKNGENTPTAHLPMGGFRHTNVANAAARNQYASVEQVQDGDFLYAADTGAADAYVMTLSPAITEYATGAEYRFLATNTNTGASTLNINGVGATAIRKNGTTALAAGDIVSGEIITVVYDGTFFQMKTNVAGPASSTDSALVRFDGTTGKIFQNSSATLDDSGNLTVSATLNAVTLQEGGTALESKYARLGAVNTFTANPIIQNTAPALVFVETDASTDEGRWDHAAVSGQLRFRAINDANGGHVNWLLVDRTGTTVDEIELAATALTLTGATTAALSATSTAKDLGSTDRRTGWVPEVISVTSSRNIAESDMNHILHADTTGGTFTLTIPTGLSGKRLEIITTGSNGITLDNAVGVTLLWLQGGSGSFSTRTIADASGVALTRRDTDDWTLTGNGIS